MKDRSASLTIIIMIVAVFLCAGMIVKLGGDKMLKHTERVNPYEINNQQAGVE